MSKNSLHRGTPLVQGLLVDRAHELIHERRQRWIYVVLTMPPSIRYSAPVMAAARSEARNRTSAATSSGAIMRPMLMLFSCAAWATTASRVLPEAWAIASATPPGPTHAGVDTGPGATALTRTPWAVNSCARTRVRLVTAA